MFYGDNETLGTSFRRALLCQRSGNEETFTLKSISGKDMLCSSFNDTEPTKKGDRVNGETKQQVGAS